jgi:hypothetical protein
MTSNLDETQNLSKSFVPGGTGLSNDSALVDIDDLDIANLLNLAEEIQKTGEVTIEKNSRPVVFERLTNPSNFTGSQKNVFSNQQNIIKKKEKYTQNLINLSKNKRRESNSEPNVLERDNNLFVPNTTENLILNSLFNCPKSYV